MPRLQHEFMGYACEFSPFDETKLAVSASQNFGVVGTGKQYVFHVDPMQIRQAASISTNDCVYDCTWSESNQFHLAFANGDGSIRLWDVKSGQILRNWLEHTAEVYSVDWNLVTKETVVSGSWDNTIKLWSPNDMKSIRTFREHTHCIYSTIWHPKNPDLFASTSGDCTLKIWDCNDERAVQTIPAHKYEILTCDWNKYNEFVIATGSVDKSIRIWDIRNPAMPTQIMHGPELAIRRLKFSPHSERTLAAASYDMTLTIWDTHARENMQVHTYGHHTEFVLGVDFNVFVENQIASTSWDETTAVWTIGSNPDFA